MPRRKWSLHIATFLLALAFATGTALAAPAPSVPVAKAPAILAEVLRWIGGFLAPARESSGRPEKPAPGAGKGTPAPSDLGSGCGMDPNGQPLCA